MKSFTLFFLMVFLSTSSSVLAQSSDQTNGYERLDVPENIQMLLGQIAKAEDNEDWEEYSSLREQIIQAWEKVNPQVAKLYSNSNSGVADLTAEGLPVSNENLFNINSEPEQSELPLESTMWGDDVLITDGRAYDISMDINRNGDIYIAVLGRKDGSSVKDSVFVYKSTDGGTTWSEWGFIWVTGSTVLFEQIELMCFDHPSGSEAYILLFYRFDNGQLRVGRRDMESPGIWSYYTIVSEGVIDFSVDRNYSFTNYRAFCVYDSSNRIYSTRSEPSSYGTVWQDKVHINGLLGKDLDFAYGWNGAVYTTFNGFNSGNLYVIENTNYADPTSWGSQYIVAQGNTDTTRHAEIIASREDDPNNKVIVVFEKRSGSTFDLYDATRDNNVWGAFNSWVLPLENKYPSLSVEYSSVQDFKGAFVQSEEGNNPPRIIKYKGYNGSIWSQSFQMSDDGNDPTGLQKPEVGSLSGSITIIAYAGSNYRDVYFDNESWTTGGSITVTAPNGGETWGVGTMQNITWTSSGVTNARIELSTNNGSTWTDIIASTPSTGSFSWTVSNTPSTQCVVRISDVSDPSTFDVSNSVFTIEVVPGVENDLSGIPDSYQLLQNFPNPFNPSTTIYYGLPEESSVVLRIYDVLGNEVFRHEEEQKPAGYHKSDFDASQLNSGVYFYRIEAGDFVKTMKMLLLK